MKKTEFMVVGDEDGVDLDVGKYKLRNIESFKYLGVTFSKNEKRDLDISNKIGQGRYAIHQLNSTLWSPNIYGKTKSNIYKAIKENICTYGAEIWELSKRNIQTTGLEKKLWNLEIRACKERKDKTMKVDGNIIDTIDAKDYLGTDIYNDKKNTNCLRKFSNGCHQNAVNVAGRH
ncbi:hypothetical protein HHI36_010356 [Cryptolaemus montrouzieri]|uniref:Uncharacterized protein n=1 Tax=Cryptolaemus montrouzieri TaxID=559131 RepID=A0ABD2MIY8_9CUCU